MFVVVFDLDGTLMDTSRDLIEAANRVMAEYGVAAQLDLSEKALAMRGGRAMMRELLLRDGAAVDEAVIDQIYPYFITIYETHVADHAQIYEGALDVVTWCREQGYGVAICTNKPSKPTHILLAALGISDLFDAVVAADTLSVKKPHPDPLYHAITLTAGEAATGAILIGDTKTDVDTARAAGVPVVLVDFDQPQEMTYGLGAEVVIDDFAQLPDVLVQYAQAPMGRV